MLVRIYSVKMPHFWKSHVVALILNAKCDRVTDCVVAKADTRAVSSLNTVCFAMVLLICWVIPPVHVM